MWGGYFRSDRIFFNEFYSHITSSSQILPFIEVTTHFWKLDTPLNIKCFSWLTIHNNILTWDLLIKKGFMGPGRFSLCRMDSKDYTHLFINCPFIVAIREVVSYLLGVIVPRDFSTIPE